MDISLTPALEDLVRAQVASGHYSNASEVVHEALHLMESNESLLTQAKVYMLQKHLDKGAHDIQHGRSRQLGSPEDISSFFRDIKGSSAV